MAESGGTITWNLDVDASKFTAGLAAARAEAVAAGGGIEGALARATSGSKMFAAGLAVVGAAAAVAGGFAVKSFIESENSLAQLDARLRSTGGAAGVTREAAIGLASSLQQVTTFSDEAILGSENLLLTFTNIGKDVFPQATQAALDLSVAFGKDLESSTILVGKALQDPIQGVSALRRVGVQLTDQQMQMIQTMMDVGDIAGAQRIILEELAKETGGSAVAAASTFGGQLKQLWNRLDEGLEVVGGVIANAIKPLVQAFLDFTKEGGAFSTIVDTTVSALDKLAPLLPFIAGGIIGGLVPAFIAWGAAAWTAAAGVWAAMVPLLPFIAIGAAVVGVLWLLWPVLKKVGLAVWEFIKPAFDAFVSVLAKVWSFIASVIVPIFVSLWNTIKLAFASIMAAIQPIMPLLKTIGMIIMVALVAPLIIAAAVIAIVVTAVGLLVAGIVWVISKLFELAAAIIGFLMPGIKMLWDIVSTVFSAIWSVISTVFESIKKTVTVVMNFIKAYIQQSVSNILAAWQTIRAVYDTVVGVFSAVLGFIGGVVGRMFGLGKDIIQGMVNGIRSMAGAIMDAIKAVAGKLWGVVAKVFGVESPSTIAYWYGQMIMLGLAEGITSGVGMVNGLLDNVMPTSLSPNVSSDIAAGGTAASAGGVTNVFQAKQLTEADIDMAANRTAYQQGMALR